MKKLRLDFRHLGNAEVLTRSQLKQIMGGSGGSGDGTCNCNSADDCTTWNEKCMNSCDGNPGDKYQGKCGCP